MTNQLISKLVTRSFATIVLWVKRVLYITVILLVGVGVYHLFIKNILDGDHIIVGFIGFWTITAYFLLPRINRILANWYVPDYFIGRVRTSDGLLGDPVNITLLGTKAQLVSAMKQAGWVQAEALSFKASVKIILAVALRKSYPTAPVSSMFLFGRKQDLAFQQEVDGNPNRRHHVRFWKAPASWLMPGGHKVNWLGAGTYDRSVGFSSYTLQFTHKIAENTDIERDYIIQTLVDAKTTQKVRIIKNYSTGYHDRNGGGDSIKTDGALPIVTLRS